jgi:ribose transport system ATP-binding protein
MLIEQQTKAGHDMSQKFEELRISDLRKGFLGVQALKGVDLLVHRGSIHALAGQNGAGKSTLVKILSGAFAPDSGTITLGGQIMHFHNPQNAQEAGIQTIYQELSLVPQLSVAENIFMGNLPRKGFAPLVDWPAMVQGAEQSLARIGYDLDVRRPVGEYSVAQQQAVELAKALRKKARLILLDEPTSTLPQPDAERLFRVLRKLADDGVTLLYISHRMDELYRLCDHVSIFRDGRSTASFPTAGSRPADVVSAMLGTSRAGLLAEAATSGERNPKLGPGRKDRILISTRGLTEAGRVADVDLDLHEGEVLGIAGLVGSGQSELVSLLAGARAPTEGVITFEGQEVRFKSPRDAISKGIGLLPQDRKAHGFVPDMSVAQNISLASLPMFSRFSVINRRRENDVAGTLASRLGMKIFGVDQAMKTLSGGTQQKAILARWLVRSARILLCDEPTRGVDVGAKEDMYELIRDFARAGGTVIVASSEINETMMCDRVLVMAKGRVVAELDHDDIDPDGKAIIACFG